MNRGQGRDCKNPALVVLSVALASHPRTQPWTTDGQQGPQRMHVKQAASQAAWKQPFCCPNNVRSGVPFNLPDIGKRKVRRGGKSGFLTAKETKPSEGVLRAELTRQQAAGSGHTQIMNKDP